MIGVGVCGIEQCQYLRDSLLCQVMNRLSCDFRALGRAGIIHPNARTETAATQCRKAIRPSVPD
jgi:hypothetical protein